MAHQFGEWPGVGRLNRVWGQGAERVVQQEGPDGGAAQTKNGGRSPSRRHAPRLGPEVTPWRWPSACRSAAEESLTRAEHSFGVPTGCSPRPSATPPSSSAKVIRIRASRKAASRLGNPSPTRPPANDPGPRRLSVEGSARPLGEEDRSSVRRTVLDPAETRTSKGNGVPQAPEPPCQPVRTRSCPRAGRASTLCRRTPHWTAHRVDEFSLALLRIPRRLFAS